jgi:hypothetical protein
LIIKCIRIPAPAVAKARARPFRIAAAATPPRNDVSEIIAVIACRRRGGPNLPATTRRQPFWIAAALRASQ